MKATEWPALVAGVLLLPGCVEPGGPQPTTAPSNFPSRVHEANTRLNSVYWIDSQTCIVQAQPSSVSVNSNNPSFTMRLEPGMVIADRQGCPNPIQGATVLLNQAYDSRVHGVLTYQVRYSNGRTSRHVLGPRG